MRILVKGTNWLGDAVMSLPTLRSLRLMEPKAHIAVLTKKSLGELYRGATSVDEVLPYDGAIGAVKAARTGKFDAALILPRSFSSALMMFSARVPRRIGYRGEGRSFMLTDALPRDRALLATHRVHYYHHLLAAFGKTPDVKAPELRVPAEAQSWAREQMNGGTWIALNPGATYGVAKQWFPDRFVAVAKKLGTRVAIIGGPAEAELGASVAKEIPGAISLAGKTTILQLAAVLARTRLLLTNDTGPMHVADAVATPIVAVFGPTDPVTTPPFGKRHTIVRKEMECSPCLKRTCPLKHHNCMKWVTVDEVLAACQGWLK